MKHVHTQLSVQTTQEITDVTEQLQELLSAQHVSSGSVTVRALHTTAAVIVQERESGLVTDIQELLARLVPTDAEYHHNQAYDDNAHAHLKTLLLPQSCTLTIRNGALVLGTWERVLLADFDTPKKRFIDVSILTE